MVQKPARYSTFQASASVAGLDLRSHDTFQAIDLICGPLDEKFDESYDFSNVALFPWILDSLDTLWNGEYADRNANEWIQWESLIADLYGAIAAIGNRKLHVKTHKHKYSVDLPEQKV